MNESIIESINLCIFGTTALPRHHPFVSWISLSWGLHHFIQRWSLLVLPPSGVVLVAASLWLDAFDQCPSELWFKFTPHAQHHLFHCRHSVLLVISRPRPRPARSPPRSPPRLRPRLSSLFWLVSKAWNAVAIILATSCAVTGVAVVATVPFVDPLVIMSPGTERESSRLCMLLWRRSIFECACSFPISSELMRFSNSWEWCAWWSGTITVLFTSLINSAV